MSNESSMRVLLESSAIAGLVTRTILHPIDTCKVRVQTAQTEVSGVCQEVHSIIHILVDRGEVDAKHLSQRRCEKFVSWFSSGDSGNSPRSLYVFHGIQDVEG